MKNMIRKISLFAASGLIVFVVNAQNAYNIPQPIANAFSAQYPHAQLKKWRSSKDVYTAFFKNDDKKYTAAYTSSGNWIQTERDISKRSGLPADLQSFLKTGQYASWHIDDMKRVRTPHENMYQVTLDNHSGSPSEYTAAGSAIDKQLSFNDNGRLIKETIL